MARPRRRRRFPDAGRVALTQGYAATYRNFDVQTQKVKLKQMKVADTEKVTVPAGTFDSKKLEVTSAEGGQTTI